MYKGNIQQASIGWVGTGVMGASMCGHIIDAGYAVNVSTRTATRAEDLVEKGAIWQPTAAALADSSDIIFTMVGSPAEVRDVYFSDQGIFSVDVSGKTLVDMGTTPPNLTLDINNQAKSLNATAIDAPVSGGDVGAANAALSIMAAGKEDAVRQLQVLFNCLGAARYLGQAGSGQHTKMCNQITVAGTMIGVCEALLYAKKAGLDLSAMLLAISGGAAACWTLDNLAPRIIADDFSPGFMVDHFVKDLGIALHEAELMGLTLPGLVLANKLYCALQLAGEGKNGTQALIHALELMEQEVD